MSAGFSSTVLPMGAALPRPVFPAGSRGQAPNIPIPTPVPSTGLQQKEPAGLERGLVPGLPGEQAAALQQPFQRARQTGSKRLPPLPQKTHRSQQCYCGASETPRKEDSSLISWEAKEKAFPGTCRGTGSSPPGVVAQTRPRATERFWHGL